MYPSFLAAGGSGNHRDLLVRFRGVGRGQRTEFEFIRDVGCRFTLLCGDITRSIHAEYFSDRNRSCKEADQGAEATEGRT
jgi:hypothetical protein